MCQFFSFRGGMVRLYLGRRLQSVLNAPARLAYHLRRSNHISDVLVCLHWLLMAERVQYIHDRRSGVQSLALIRAAIPRSTQLRRRLTSPPTAPFR